MPKFYHYFFHSACSDCVVLLLLVFLLFSQISKCLLYQARGDNSSTTFHHSVTLSSGGLFDQVCLCCPFIPPEALSLMAVSFRIKVTVFTYKQIIRKPNRSPGLWSCLGTPHLDVLTAPQVGYNFSQHLPLGSGPLPHVLESPDGSLHASPPPPFPRRSPGLSRPSSSFRCWHHIDFRAR